MYNEIAAKRQRLLAKAYEKIEEAREYIYDAIYDEYDHCELLEMEMWVEKIDEVLEYLVTYVNDDSDVEKADEFLYGRKE